MKPIMLSLLFCLCASNLIADEALPVPPRFYLIEQGTAKDITNDVLAEKQPLAGLCKITVVGYVRYPEIYLTASPVGLIDLINIAGSLSSPDGSMSSPMVFLINETVNQSVQKYDIRKATEIMAKDPKAQPMLLGNEIVYRSGILY